jgi:ketosteroid isomerase-like protein
MPVDILGRTIACDTTVEENMKIDRRFAAFLTVALLLAGVPEAVRADEAEDQVKNAYAAWDAAFNKKDAAALAAFYDDDAYLLPPSHKVIEGPKGVAEFFGGLFKGGVHGHKLELIEADGNGNLVYGAAKWSATGKDDKGKKKEFSGVATHVFEKQSDGSLKLKLQTWN